MGTIQKVELQNNFKDQTGSQITEGTPVNVSNVVSPVWIMNPISNFSATVQSIATGSTTIKTTSTTKKTYLTGAFIAYVKNAACDIATGSLQISYVTSGATLSLIRLPILTLTADSGTLSLSFPPLLIDPGTTIVLGGTFTAGAMSKTAGIVGYEI